jgi:pilus assembly protein Flp/PilA
VLAGGSGLGFSQSDPNGVSGNRGGSMKNLALGIKHFISDEKGATAVEYGLLVALITVAVLVTVLAVGQKLEEVFNRIQRCLNNSINCGP